MNPQEAYLQRVNSLVASLSDVLSASERAEVNHLILHGEPAEGVLSLAWIIHKGGKRVSKKVVLDIFVLTEGLILKEHFPPGFETYGGS
jgi:hypothetical protein